MDQTQLALLALLIGVVIGGCVSVVVTTALRVRRKAAEETSSRLPDGVGEVLKAIEDPAVVVDSSGTVVAASSMAEVFHIHLGEVLENDELRALARRVRDTRSTTTESLRLRRGPAPAEPRLVAARCLPVSPRLTLLILRDITERQRLEQMRRDFVANTSHELKTPVGAVSLLAEAIESAADDPDMVRNFAGRLSSEANRLNVLTARIMSLSRLQAADELHEMRDVSVDEVVASAVEAHTLQASAAEVELVRGGDRRAYVRGDAQVLAEAVGNLVSNAIAYSPAGSKVGIGVKAFEGVVEIAVTDRGIGIPEEDQQRIFERFYRADQARSRRTGGTGLGLSIVKHAVQRHGGEVRLWSRPGRGSTFTVRLPQVAPPVREDNTPAKPRRKPRKSAARASATKGDPA